MNQDHIGDIGNGVGPGGNLTAREAEMLRLISRGLRNREIAETLGISLKTVEAHIGRVLLKLGATSRTQAAILAIRGGRLDRVESGTLHADRFGSSVTTEPPPNRCEMTGEPG